MVLPADAARKLLNTVTGALEGQTPPVRAVVSPTAKSNPSLLKLKFVVAGVRNVSPILAGDRRNMEPVRRCYSEFADRGPIVSQE